MNFPTLPLAVAALLSISLTVLASPTADLPQLPAAALHRALPQIPVAPPPVVGDTLKRYRLPPPGTPVPDHMPPGLLPAEGIFFLAPYDSGESPEHRGPILFPPPDNF